jgi:hypothetical protein
MKLLILVVCVAAVAFGQCTEGGTMTVPLACPAGQARAGDLACCTATTCMSFSGTCPAGQTEIGVDSAKECAGPTCTAAECCKVETGSCEEALSNSVTLFTDCLMASKAPTDASMAAIGSDIAVCCPRDIAGTCFDNYLKAAMTGASLCTSPRQLNTDEAVAYAAGTDDATCCMDVPVNVCALHSCTQPVAPKEGFAWATLAPATGTADDTVCGCMTGCSTSFCAKVGLVPDYSGMHYCDTAAGCVWPNGGTAAAPASCCVAAPVPTSAETSAPASSASGVAASLAVVAVAFAALL